ncbi:hypothetical protein ASE11_25000 [Hydrogenophaga sp. Root209]|uniref:hypothetical protein n=1 Tax=Hydrogenophaga sp. Root209 TaxID=1736490 RepID=UPI0006FA68D9|nr:hypothetical protein [Hydrogenophaga sp. Root209]KRC02685.1 hypothetical protein ASE11_25000 [Hydrogenophaga sp. Root209]
MGSKRQRTIVGRPQREIDRKASAIGQAVREALAETLNKAQRINAQSARRKAAAGQPKLYAWHAPAVDCISNGKARTPYEFGVKVCIASTLHGNLIAGARAFHGNPYDGHTLAEQLEQATILMQDSATKSATAFVDLGYRGKAKRISERKAAQTAPGHRAHHWPPQERPSDGSLPSQR